MAYIVGAIHESPLQMVVQREICGSPADVCPHCGFIEDRDVNAAINILKLALCTVGHTGTYAWGDLLFKERLEPSCRLTASPQTKNLRVFKTGECQFPDPLLARSGD